MSKEKLKDRARDELFSHINRCGVLQAAPEDQKTWMEETIDYLAERYPDLGEPDLQELHDVGMRFCKPAIPHGTDGSTDGSTEAETAAVASGAENTAEAKEDANAA